MDSYKFLYNILMTEDPEESIKSNLDELLKLIPELESEIGFEHKHPEHHLNVWEHTLCAIKNSIMDFDVRFALLLHDIGKPITCTEENGIRHFYNHPSVSAKMTIEIMNRLGFPENYKKEIHYLVLNHDYPIYEKDIINNYSLTVKRYEIQKSDALAHHPDKLEKRERYLNNILLKIKRFESQN